MTGSSKRQEQPAHADGRRTEGHVMGTDDVPEQGAVMLDTVRDLVGIVVDVDGPLVRLRPGGSKATWRARLADVFPASPMQELRAKVADINALRLWDGRG
jgi:hypothetical protein